MGLYEKWCESTKENNKRKYYWTYVEKDGGRDDIAASLAASLISKYSGFMVSQKEQSITHYRVASAKLLHIATDAQIKGTI